MGETGCSHVTHWINEKDVLMKTGECEELEKPSFSYYTGADEDANRNTLHPRAEELGVISVEQVDLHDVFSESS